MYSKVFWMTCQADQTENVMTHYDSVVTPAIRASEKHVGQQLISITENRWLLVSHFVSSDAAVIAEPLVNELIEGLVKKFSIQLELVGEGNAARSI